MSDFSRKFGRDNKGYSSGAYVNGYPSLEWQRYNSFARGLVTSDSREDVPKDSSPDALDVEVTARGGLLPVPGTSEYELVAGRLVRQMTVQASLDYTSELVLFAPPFVGIKSSGATTWINADIPGGNRSYAWTNFGGTLIFGNGAVGTYAHEANKNEIELLEKAPAATDYLSFAGRVFAFGAIIGGNREVMGIRWSAANSDYKDWDGTGSGFELLIDEMSSGDRIVAARGMGLDMMAIICRHSVWVGRATKVARRPADFRPMVPSVGSPVAATCQTSRHGVTFLSDDGVRLFNGTDAVLISTQINDSLLPIDTTQLNNYSSFYDPLRQQYHLFTPAETWVYDFEFQRWHRRSIKPLAAVLFAEQYDALTWSELVGTWAAQQLTWQDYRPVEGNDPDILFLAQDGADTLIHKQDALSSSNFGEAMAPYWELARLEGQFINQLITVKRVDIEFRGFGTVVIQTPNQHGVLTDYRQKVLPGDDELATRTAFGEKTGRGVAARLNFLEGSPEISRVEIGFTLRGPRIERRDIRLIQLQDLGELIQGNYTDFSNYTTGQAPTGWLSPYNAGAFTVVADPSATGGKVLRWTNPTSQGRFVANLWTAFGAQTYVEIATRFRYNTGVYTGYPLLARANGLLGASAKGYSAYVSPFGGSPLTAVGELSDVSSGSISTLQQLIFSSGYFVAATWYNQILRLTQNGGATNLKLLTWKNSDPRPAGWQISFDDVSPLAAGYVGVGASAFLLNYGIDFDFFSAAVNGATAPLAPPRPGWIVEPGKFSFRIEDIDEGVTVRIDGVVYNPTAGVLNVSLNTAPVKIEFLEAGGKLFGVFNGVVQSPKVYSFSYTYTQE